MAGVLLGVALFLAVALMGLLIGIRGRRRRPARARRSRPLPAQALRFLPSDEADRRKARRSNVFTGRYKGGLTSQEWNQARTYPTQRGERVRSRNEAQIADHLFTRGFEYEYEPEICGYRPDFYLPRYGIVIEYWGLQAKGDPRRRRKTHAFLKNGYRLVSLEPGKDVGLETDLRRQLDHKMRD